MPGFPATRVVKLRYVTSIDLNPALASKSFHQFRANSLFDPDYTGIGHQPLGFDQLVTPFYNHYTVVGSKITANFVYSSSNINEGSMIGIYLSDDDQIPVAGLDIAEQGLGKYRVVPSVNYAAIGGKTPTISNTFSAKKMFNLTDIKDNTARVGAPVTANPSEDAIFTVWTQGLNSAVDYGTTRVLITMNFTAICSEPKSLVSS